MHDAMLAMIRETLEDLSARRRASERDAAAIIAAAERDAESIIRSARMAFGAAEPSAKHSTDPPDEGSATHYPTASASPSVGVDAGPTLGPLGAIARPDRTENPDDPFFEFLRGALEDNAPLGPNGDGIGR
jgi:hypothetical protein